MIYSLSAWLWIHYYVCTSKSEGGEKKEKKRVVPFLHSCLIITSREKERAQGVQRRKRQHLNKDKKKQNKKNHIMQFLSFYPINVTCQCCVLTASTSLSIGGRASKQGHTRKTGSIPGEECKSTVIYIYISAFKQSY